ncbi:MAG: type II secretion system protein [Verrucomicrobiae bacterium]|nr:type II secretion system protein [Verrucomicrobiae bacterium]
MKFNLTCNWRRGDNRRAAGFTLAEVLAALVFMAIVIPVAIEGLRLAGMAGQVAERKSGALRVSDLVLNQAILNRQWQQPLQEGAVREGQYDYRWVVQLDPWQEPSLRLITVRVFYTVQGQEFEVALSSLVDITQ